MKLQQFRGSGVALVTPFRNGQIDFPALAQVIEHVLEGGVDFLVSLGTTGEAVTLSAKEMREVLDFTIKINAGRKPIVAGCFGGNDTRSLVELIRQFDFDGIDVIMSASPSYNKPTQEGIYQHFMKIAEAAPLPVIMYNVPGRTASNMEASTILRLAHAGGNRFLAVKEASADMVQGQEILKDRPDGFLVLSGDDPTALPLIGCGADGGISVIANALPGVFSEMVHQSLQNNWPEARDLAFRMHHLHPPLYAEGNPAGVKGALELLGICSREVRLPLTPLSDSGMQKLQVELEKTGLLHKAS
ncbi:MAG: 4-hydroxy-tetrahydrodipicolinate synthase [Saprospiraceae bacterium]|nr:4-hydroxy-tetrahydrodipicolinate synthase [Saprospiraceae bacterium]